MTHALGGDALDSCSICSARCVHARCDGDACVGHCSSRYLPTVDNILQATQLVCQMRNIKERKNTWNKTRARTRIQCNRKKIPIRFQCLFFLCSNEPRISHINLKSLWLCFLLSLEHECNSNRFIALIGLNNDECSSARSMHGAQRSHAPFDDTFWKCKYERITILGAFIAIMALNS